MSPQNRPPLVDDRAVRTGPFDPVEAGNRRHGKNAVPRERRLLAFGVGLTTGAENAIFPESGSE